MVGVDGAEGGFDGRAKPGYPIAHAATEERNPNAGANKNSWRTNRGRTCRMKLAIQFRALPRRDLIQIFRGHIISRTQKRNSLALEKRA